MKQLFEPVQVTQTKFAGQVPVILGEVQDILIKKNADYGGASMDLGMTGNYVHLHDKVTRLRSLLNRAATTGEPPVFESVEDTLRDIIGYATIGLVILGANKEPT